MKNPLTSTGIEPATFRFVVQYLKRSATAVPPELQYAQLKKRKFIPLFFNYIFRLDRPLLG